MRLLELFRSTGLHRTVWRKRGERLTRQRIEHKVEAPPRARTYIAIEDPADAPPTDR